MNRTATKKFATSIIVVVVFVTASTHLAVNTEVAWPCTVNPALSAGAAVACASSESSPASPRITYANNPQTGDIMMTVEF